MSFFGRKLPPRGDTEQKASNYGDLPILSEVQKAATKNRIDADSLDADKWIREAHRGSDKAHTWNQSFKQK